MITLRYLLILHRHPGAARYEWPLLNEIDFGSTDGIPVETARQRLSATYAAWALGNVGTYAKWRAVVLYVPRARAVSSGIRRRLNAGAIRRRRAPDAAACRPLIERSIIVIPFEGGEFL